MKPIFLIIALLGLTACGSPPIAKKSTPTPAPPPPMPAEAVKIDKPVNVSFSTYSKEWPVGWGWIDPDEKHDRTPYDVKKGVLRVKLTSKKDLAGDRRNAPRYVKAIEGDFQIETRIKFLPKENYQGAGLLIFKDDNNYIRFERAYGGVGGGGEGLRIDVRRGAEYFPVLTPGQIETGAEVVDLKMVRNGPVFTAYWRLDEESEWREAGEFESDYPTTILAGVVACNTAREVTAEFAYIRLLPAVAK
jgi:cytochrome c